MNGDPVIRVLRGVPDPHELAAVVAVVVGLARAATSHPVAAVPAPGPWRQCSPHAIGPRGPHEVEIWDRHDDPA